MGVTKTNITSNGGGATASISMAEGATAVTTVVATNSRNSLSYSISGGANAALFQIGSISGVLTFRVPSIAGVYAVTVSAQGRGGGTDTQALTVTVVGAVDTTLPVLSLPNGVQLADTTATLTVSTTEPAGRVYWIETTLATPPSKAQVKLGQKSDGALAPSFGSRAVVFSGAQTITAGGVPAGTRYAYFMHEDTSGNQSLVASSPSWVQTIATTGNWILASGTWNDAGVWDDTAAWKDSP